jgi:tRNA U34 2-thiouridine synthase MnmA/TrmU
VRALARTLGLATADKPESQELCFVPDGDTGAAVERLRPGRAPGSGEIVDEDGRVLGKHAGVHRFTVGQRRGLGGGLNRQTDSGSFQHGPRYVKALDAGQNRVVVTDLAGLASGSGRVERVSWISGEAPREAFGACVRIRYRHEGAPARVTPLPDGNAEIAFAAPVRALTPGQAAVFYAGDRVLGRLSRGRAGMSRVHRRRAACGPGYGSPNPSCWPLRSRTPRPRTSGTERAATNGSSSSGTPCSASWWRVSCTRRIRTGVRAS